MALKIKSQNADVATTGTKEVDYAMKKGIVCLVYVLFKEAGKVPDYYDLHNGVFEMQRRLEEKFNITLGYKFEDPAIGEHFNKRLQSDIELWDVQGWVDNGTKTLQSGYMVDELKPSKEVYDFLMQFIKKNRDMIGAVADKKGLDKIKDWPKLRNAGQPEKSAGIGS